MFKRSKMLAAAAVLAANPAAALEIIDIEVERQGRTFVASAEFVLDVERSLAFGAFTAFDRLAALNPSVIASESEPRADNVVRVRTRMKDCLGVFCRSFALVEDLEVLERRSITARIVPRLSDFEDGQSRWHFVSVGTQTRVSFRSTMTPRFWIPPFLGGPAVRRALRRQIRHAADVLEAR